MSKILLLISTLLATPALAAGVPDWTYGGDSNGEEHWGDISHRYVTCALGKEQSPIEISTTLPLGKESLHFRYSTTQAAVTFDNHAMVIHPKSAQNIRIKEREYTLESITLHMPGQHIIQGAFYLFEMEMLHTDKQGNRLMVSVFGQAGEANPAIDSMLDKSDTLIDLNKLLPPTHEYYAYRGSLTYPPCTEGIEWRVFKMPVSVSEEQLEKLGSIIGRNSRLTQPLNGRTVLSSD